MSVLFQVRYHPSVLSKDIPKLPASYRRRIRKVIESKLFVAPDRFGEPLRRSLKGYWKVRVGDYRIIYKIAGFNVVVLRIGHRREIYKNV
jgi:mRNA interferase RelE/StbE